MAAPAARRTNPIVWVLVVVLGVFVLCGLGAASLGYFVLHRVHQAGVSFDRTHGGGIAITGRDGASVEIGGEGKAPSWVPAYPGARPAFSVRARGNLNGPKGTEGEGGEFTFTTPDSASDVLAYYEKKCTGMNMKVNLSSASDDGGTVVAADDGDQRSVTIGATRTMGHTTVVVTYGSKN
jgi:hypothetical protein